MDEVTSLLFDLDGFRVVSVLEMEGGGRQAVVEGVTEEQACLGGPAFSGQLIRA